MKSSSPTKRVFISESHQSLRLVLGNRVFKSDVYGTGKNCTVEIDEIDVASGLSMGYRKAYKVPGRIKWGIIIERYTDDTKRRLP